jgi:sugar lactone lactonase YvrE/DNA-binding IclR family transcriptional regulator
MSTTLANGAIPGAQALQKGLAVLDAVGDADRPQRFKDLVEATGLPKGTLHRILQALIEQRLVRIDERDSTYRLGHRLFELAHKVWGAFDLRGAAAPELDRLARETGETVTLAEIDGAEALYIDERNSGQAFGLRIGVGRRAPCHATAVGKAMLAVLPPPEQAALLGRLALERFTPRTITVRRELAVDLALARARGYALSEEEHLEGVVAVAVPVLDHRGVPIAALGLLGPRERLSEDQLHSTGRSLMEASRRISGNAGQTPISMITPPGPEGAPSAGVECVLPATAWLGEGPLWSPAERCLYWVDILAPAVHRFDPHTGHNQTRRLDRLIGAVALRAGGGLVALTQDGLERLDFATGRLDSIADPEADIPDNRFNDAKCDRAGRLWAGTTRLDSLPGRGALYRFDQAGFARMASGLTVSNGLDWSPDDTRFYFADSAESRVYVYDFDPARGEIHNRRVLIETSPEDGRPDGLTVDAEGGIWCAMWGGWAIRRYTPDGKLDTIVRLPVPRPSSCTFGGGDLATLYITSGRIRLSARHLADAPLSGSLFGHRPGVRGLPATAFAG